jgi:hypothetical protein
VRHRGWTRQVVGEATVVQVWRWSSCRCASGREMIVARVKVHGRVAAHLKHKNSSDRRD